MRGHGFSELHDAAQPLQNLCHWWQCRRRNFSHVKIFNTVTFQKEDPGKQLPCVLKLDVINKLTRISTAKPRNVLLINSYKDFLPYLNMLLYNPKNWTVLPTNNHRHRNVFIFMQLFYTLYLLFSVLRGHSKPIQIKSNKKQSTIIHLKNLQHCYIRKKTFLVSTLCSQCSQHSNICYW